MTVSSSPKSTAGSAQARSTSRSPDEGVPPVASGVAPDGSPVEVYRRLPPAGEAELVHAAIGANASILELGCGTGRITRGLLRLGHPVTAVDDSPAMLAELPREAEAVQADARTLAIGRHFDVALLASHLLNSPRVDSEAFARVARQHVRPNGAVIAEVYPPGFDWSAAVGRSTTLGHVTLTLTRADVDSAGVDAEVLYEVDDHRWRQPFRAECLNEAELLALLAMAGIPLERWLDRSKGWLLARAQPG